MANLSKDQIDELKNLGIITAVDDSNDLADQTVDNLKNSKFITITDPSEDIEAAVTNQIHVTGVLLDIDDEEEMEVGGGISLEYIISPDDATNKNVTITSSDENVLEVDYNEEEDDWSGIAVGEGTATVTVTTEDGGFTDSKRVIVIDPVIPVTGVEITNEETSVGVGDSLTIDYSITPDDATNQNVTMESSDESVFTVHFEKHDNSWYVRGVGAGTATVTVTTEDGEFTDSVEITVDDV